MNARSNKRNKAKIKTLRQIVKGKGEVIETYKPQDLEKAIDYVIKYKPEVTLPDGGDGMQLLFYTMFIKKWPNAVPIPPMAVSPSGTWNILAKHVDMKPKQWHSYLEHIVETPLDELSTQDVGLIKIRDYERRLLYGFTFGTGLPVSILNEYYTAKELKTIKLASMLGKFTMSAMFKHMPILSKAARFFVKENISTGKFFDRFAEKRRYKLTNKKGKTIETSLLGIMAQTVPSLGLPKCNIFYRATNTEKFHVLGTKHDILEALVLSPALYTGNMHLLSPEHLIDLQTDYFKIESDERFNYQVNGDLEYLGEEFNTNQVELSHGRRIHLIKYFG
jgi:diacylglycerol kinase family enzyme